MKKLLLTLACLTLPAIDAGAAQRLPHQGAALVGFDAHQPHLAFGEIQHLQRAGMLDNALDVIGHQLLGTDQHVHRQGFVFE